jgi:hypothetical protein
LGHALIFFSFSMAAKSSPPSTTNGFSATVKHMEDFVILVPLLRILCG